MEIDINITPKCFHCNRTLLMHIEHGKSTGDITVRVGICIECVKLAVEGACKALKV